MTVPGRRPERAGRLFAGTSGFSYPAWAPRFYPSGTRGDGLLPAYATRLPACELNNTYYRHPSAGTIAGWCGAVPAEFRFSVKAQRGGSIRALIDDPLATVPWLSAPYRLFGERLGTVLFRVPAEIAVDEARLAAFLAVWPRDLPLTLECRDPSWAIDEVFALLRAAGAAWCSTDLDDEAELPALRVTAPWLYVRLRREAYTDDDLADWADRLVPFLDDGLDVYALFRHDADGASPLRAVALAGLVAERRAH